MNQIKLTSPVIVLTEAFRLRSLDLPMLEDSVEANIVDQLNRGGYTNVVPYLFNIIARLQAKRSLKKPVGDYAPGFVVENTATNQQGTIAEVKSKFIKVRMNDNGKFDEELTTFRRYEDEKSDLDPIDVLKVIYKNSDDEDDEDGKEVEERKLSVLKERFTDNATNSDDTNYDFTPEAEEQLALLRNELNPTSRFVNAIANIIKSNEIYNHGGVKVPNWDINFFTISVFEKLFEEFELTLDEEFKVSVKNIRKGYTLCGIRLKTKNDSEITLLAHGEAGWQEKETGNWKQFCSNKVKDNKDDFYPALTCQIESYYREGEEDEFELYNKVINRIFDIFRDNIQNDDFKKFDRISDEAVLFDAKARRKEEKKAEADSKKKSSEGGEKKKKKSKKEKLTEDAMSVIANASAHLNKDKAKEEEKKTPEVAEEVRELN